MKTCRAERTPALSISAERLSLRMRECRHRVRLRGISRVGVPKDQLGVAVQHDVVKQQSTPVILAFPFAQVRKKRREGGGVGEARRCLLKARASDAHKSPIANLQTPNSGRSGLTYCEADEVEPFLIHSATSTSVVGRTILKET